MNDSEPIDLPSVPDAAAWSPALFALMAHLVSHGRASAADLASAAGCDPAALDDELRRLLEAGLVERDDPVHGEGPATYTATAAGRTAFSEQVDLLRASVTDAK
jgi:DNA-binding MarR family transcriptional regulator